MTPAEDYRRKAAEFMARARDEPSPQLQADYAKMAAQYVRLAEQADRNAATDLCTSRQQNR